MRIFFMKTAAFVLAAGLVLAGCGNPAGGGGPTNNPLPIQVSGTVDKEALTALEDALGLEAGEAAIELRTPQGGKIAEAEIKSNGTWTAAIPPTYTGSEIVIVIVIPGDGGDDRVIECGTITAKSGGVSVEVEIPDAESVYTVTLIDTENGSSSVSREDHILLGEVITVTANPDSGYNVKDVTVWISGEEDEYIEVEKKGENTWTFTMPAGNVTVRVDFNENITVVDAFDLTGLVTAPVRGAAPQSTGINHTQYTGSIAWKTSTNVDHTGTFAASTVYKAVVTLTANTGWTFSGLGTNSFTYIGASVTNTTGNGPITVTITFPATAGEGEPNPVNDFNLTNLVTAPVRGAAPQSTGINHIQYTGSIVWQTAGGDSPGAAFGPDTVYKAVVALTANTGWIFSGLGGTNTFTHTGATSVTYTTGSGVITITIVFPATEAEGGQGTDPGTEIPIGNPSVTLYLNGENSKTVLVHNGTTLIGVDTGIFTVSIGPGDYEEITWQVNGTIAAEYSDKTFIKLPTRAAVIYRITVEAIPVGGTKNSGVHTFEVGPVSE